jgi:hypothetical protein
MVSTGNLSVGPLLHVTELDITNNKPLFGNGRHCNTNNAVYRSSETSFAFHIHGNDKLTLFCLS